MEMSHGVTGWILFVLIGAIVLPQLWAQMGRQAADPVLPADTPPWNILDTVMALAFVGVCASLFVLEYVYRSPDWSRPRWLAASIGSYLSAIMCWAAAVAPKRSRILFQQHSGAVRNAFVMLAVGTISLALAAMAGP